MVVVPSADPVADVGVDEEVDAGVVDCVGADWEVAEGEVVAELLSDIMGGVSHYR